MGRGPGSSSKPTPTRFGFIQLARCFIVSRAEVRTGQTSASKVSCRDRYPKILRDDGCDFIRFFFDCVAQLLNVFFALGEILEAQRAEKSHADEKEYLLSCIAAFPSTASITLTAAPT